MNMKNLEYKNKNKQILRMNNFMSLDFKGLKVRKDCKHKMYLNCWITLKQMIKINMIKYQMFSMIKIDIKKILLITNKTIKQSNFKIIKDLKRIIIFLIQ